MKKTILLFLLLPLVMNAQVGINNPSPGSTLDVTAKAPTGTATNVDGITIPRIDRQRAQSMTGTPTSTMIYVSSIATGTQTGTAINIDSIGFYFYNGAAWIKVDSTIYDRNGSLSSARNVNLAGNNLGFTGTGNVGIGIANPNAKLDVIGKVKITDGTQADGKVLTSDANGLASWSATPATSLYFVSANSWGGTNAPSNYTSTTHPTGATPANVNDRYLVNTLANVNNLGPDAPTAPTFGLSPLYYKIPITGTYRITLYTDIGADNRDVTPPVPLAYTRIAIAAFNGTTQLKVNSDNVVTSSAGTMINIWKLEAGNIVFPYSAGIVPGNNQLVETTFTVERVN